MHPAEAEQVVVKFQRALSADGLGLRPKSALFLLPAAKLSGLREQITLCRRRRRPSSVRVLHHLSHQSRLSIINCGYMDIVDILGEI